MDSCCTKKTFQKNNDFLVKNWWRLYNQKLMKISDERQVVFKWCTWTDDSKLIHTTAQHAHEPHNKKVDKILDERKLMLVEFSNKRWKWFPNFQQIYAISRLKLIQLICENDGVSSGFWSIQKKPVDSRICDGEELFFWTNNKVKTRNFHTQIKLWNENTQESYHSQIDHCSIQNSSKIHHLELELEHLAKKTVL